MQTPVLQNKRKRKKMDMVVHICHPSDKRSVKQKHQGPAGLGKKQDPISKIIREKGLEV
jgi:hypothetical protein